MDQFLAHLGLWCRASGGRAPLPTLPWRDVPGHHRSHVHQRKFAHHHSLADDGSSADIGATADSRAAAEDALRSQRGEILNHVIVRQSQMRHYGYMCSYAYRSSEHRIREQDGAMADGRR